MIEVKSREETLKAQKLVLQARDQILPDLRKIPGVHSTGIMLKRDESGNPTDELCLGIFCDRNLIDEPVSRDFPDGMGVPETIYLEGNGARSLDFVNTQLVEVPANPQNQTGANRSRVRPVKGGYEIGPPVGVDNLVGPVSGSSGTVGGCVWGFRVEQAGFFNQ